MAKTKKTSTVKKTVNKNKASVKATSSSEEPKKVFYVGVVNPLDKQRSLLKVTADYLRMLQNIEKLKVTRKAKRGLITDFHKAMQGIRDDAAKLYKLLPKYVIPKKEKPVPQKVIVEEKPVIVVPKKVAVKTEIDSLEAELAAIEGRLGSM